MTAGKAEHAVHITWEGDELIFADVQLEDETGTVATDSDVMLSAEVTGARLLGFGSGNPKPLGNYNEGRTMTWNGRAQMILLRAGDEKIDIKVQAE